MVWQKQSMEKGLMELEPRDQLNSLLLCLRFKLKDNSKADKESLKKKLNGVLSIIEGNGQFKL